MQKLVTVYLDSIAYSQGKWLQTDHAKRHGCIEEHLEDYLTDGWRIINIHGVGGADQGPQARGWMVVVLEK